jgi:dipeptidase E
MSRRLLLLGNSRDEQGRYLHHAREPIGALFGGVRRALFVPFAGVTVSWDEYAARVAEALSAVGVEVEPLHERGDMAAAVREAEGIVVGGGNTFHLLARLYEAPGGGGGLLDALRGRVAEGVPYLGWSAGSVVACPTIRTTNDMPIVEPPHLAALGLVGFQINAHFTDAHPAGFQGETRRERLAEFVAANPDVPVVGLPEGSMLRVDGPDVALLGPHDAALFGVPGVDHLAPGAVPAGVLEPARVDAAGVGRSAGD